MTVAQVSPSTSVPVAKLKPALRSSAPGERKHLVLDRRFGKYGGCFQRLLRMNVQSSPSSHLDYRRIWKTSRVIKRVTCQRCSPFLEALDLRKRASQNRGGMEGDSRANNHPEKNGPPSPLSFPCHRPLMFPAKSLSISDCDHRMALGPDGLQSRMPSFALSLQLWDC